MYETCHNQSECAVVMSARSMPNVSWMTLAVGARQFVVQDAFEMR